MTRVNEAMSAFYAATVELGVADKVTTFTASDFGRTLSSNADGSDHGWGSHHFVMGGAVNGGRFYGTAPHVSIQTNDQVGQGRLLPSTSVDQFAATLARWFGCATGELPGILPNVGNFSNTNLGFVWNGDTPHFLAKGAGPRCQRSGHVNGGASSIPCLWADL